MDPPDFQPEIKFRWCRTVRCRAQEVTLVLTSVTGTQVTLTWKADLGWYESKPIPVPCGFHTGFILIRDKVLDVVSGRLEPRERDYKVDPFHIVPHKFAVELFLESDEASPFWSDAPELRLRYLSSDHLERLGTGKDDGLYAEEGGGAGKGRGGGFRTRKWVSSTALDSPRGQKRSKARAPFADSSIRGFPPCDDGDNDELPLRRSGSLARGRSQGQLCPASASYGSLREQGILGASTSSPNLSKAFQVAVDLSRASSKFLAGLSSTSSGVCLGYEDGSDPPSPDNKDSAHADSSYAAGGETSQESEAGERVGGGGEGGAEGARRKRYLYGSSERGRSLHLEDLQDTWAAKRQRESLGNTTSSTSFEDLLTSVSVARKEAAKTELNLLRFDTIKQERLVQEILEPSDSDFEDEEAACETSSTSDQRGRYGCVITFESRSTSMDDVGSPRALEDALVSLTSSESHHEFTLESPPQPLPRRPRLAQTSSVEEGQGSPDKGEVEDVFAEEGLSSFVSPQPRPRTRTPTASEGPVTSPKAEKLTSVGAFATEEAEEKEIPGINEGPGATRTQNQKGRQKPQELKSESRHRRARSPDVEDDDEDFQYDSLKHEDEHLPIDIRNIDSEDSLVSSRPGGHLGEDADDAEDAASGRSGSYNVSGALATYSSVEGEVPTDSLTLLQPGSQKATVREAEEFVRGRDKGRTGSGGDMVMGDHGDDDQGRSDSDYGDRIRDNDHRIKSYGETDDRAYSRGNSGIRRRVKDGDTDERCGDGIPGRDGSAEKGSSEHRPSSLKKPREGQAEMKRARVSEGHEGKIRGQEEGPGVSRGRLSPQERTERAPRGPSAPEKARRRLSFPRGDGDAVPPSDDVAREGDDSENRRPCIVRMHHAGTQTTRKVTQATSTEDHKRHALPRSTPKYSRSPLRNRAANGQVEAPYTPLPDRFSGPWSHRLPGTVAATAAVGTAGVAGAAHALPHSYATSAHAPTHVPSPAHGPTHAPSPAFATHGKHDLATLQRNLYNLVERDTRRLNSSYLADLQARKLHFQGPHLSPDYSHHQTHHTPQPHHTSTPQPLPPYPPKRPYPPTSHLYSSSPSSSSSTYLHQYPMLSSVSLKPSSSTYSPSKPPNHHLTSSRTYDQSEARTRSSRVAYAGSVSDLSRLRQTSKHFYETYTSHGVRGSASLPDLRPPSARARLYAHEQQPPNDSASTHVHFGPRHAHSELDLMVGGARVHWCGDDSDSGGSTDSLIDEACHVTATPLDLSGSTLQMDSFRSRRRRRSSRRRRSRSHQGAFSAWRERDEEALAGGAGRPYLPYRFDQISPGQQVKVLAPGGGVAVARVLTNQKSPFSNLTKREYRSSSVSSSAHSASAVTVVLLSEPNRLQGSIVTVPLEKVLLAWPTN
ncbi:uncharacterized protein LOC122262756 isoform X2 [Penaeus japonicus]|uniref:uncharacterized protein LOC122262756 isoform X2 n=1 Tax=Penaeus japonicus TaxID=27405 RepID=UPI001C71425F|nr:uncharacterized protein LOC122262756 isoform X2 [Penaeus japonicus]